MAESEQDSSATAFGEQEPRIKQTARKSTGGRSNFVHSNPNLPRTIRARIGAETDPVPEGKHVDAGPEHHSTIVPANHGAAITEAEERTQAQEREDRKAHVKEMEHARNEPGFKTTDRNPVNTAADSGKQASVANKMMDSRKAHYGVMQSDR
ncbi:g3967 [Coccomyxa elongata]